MLSIIIPTLNEEKNLFIILSCIAKEKIKNLEIIIADAGSKDKTIEIAKQFDCVITDGGLPACGRNKGAKIAKGDILLFLDADLLLSQDFIKKSLKTFKEERLAIASFPIYPQKNNIYLNPLTMNLIYNYPQRILERIFPLGAMGIMVRKDVYEKVKGFDETIKLAEDHCFVQDCANLGKFGTIECASVYMPTRRFEKDGYFRTGIKYLLCSLHMIFIGPVRSDILKYTFDYEDNKKK
ncbi:MAG: glycosyltransferase [Candidatus Pacebacteria bacterium]|jgi:glycosyltransferase involved in cell wall biosynthesis|nr:glycosyltransferase [Candidatus Paceibacterota bacterium]